jgi:hypothetical protein
MAELAQGRTIDWGQQHLVLMLESVGTTSMTAVCTISDLCAHPEMVQPLREDVIRVLQEHKCWNKAALYQMKLLDSFLKESALMHPISLIVIPTCEL